MNNSNQMTLDYFNDFYYLEAIKTDIQRRTASNPEVGFRHSVRKLLEDTEYIYEEVAKNLSYRTFVYLWAACLGEARHASDTMAKDEYIPQLVQEHRGEVFARARNFPPNKKNIQTIINIFSRDWRGSFGGKAWKHIAESLLLYEKDPISFIDHVIDLEHNTGTVFNKTEASAYLGFTCCYAGELKYFLDYKFSHNILEDPYDLGTVLVSREVYELVKRHNIIFHGRFVATWLIPNFRSLPEYEIKWGKATLKTERKWAEWTNVKKGNRPTMGNVVIICEQKIQAEIWKSEEELEKIAIQTAKEYAIKNIKHFISRVNIKNMKNHNSKKLAMIPGSYRFFPKCVRVLTKYGTYTFKTKERIGETGDYKPNGYLCIKKNVLYLVCEEGEIELEARDLPYFIQITEG